MSNSRTDRTLVPQYFKKTTISHLSYSDYNKKNSVATEKIESSDVRGYVEKYLSVGEVVIDQTAAFMSTSSYFERKR